MRPPARRAATLAAAAILAIASWAEPADAAAAAAAEVAPFADLDSIGPGDGRAILRLLRAAGYGARMTRDPGGRPRILSAARGLRFTIEFYDCDDDRRSCRSIQFHAWLAPEPPPDLATLNAWNLSERFVYAVLTEDGSVALRYDIDMSRGATARQMRDHFDIWLHQIAGFKAHVGWRRNRAAR